VILKLGGSVLTDKSDEETLAEGFGDVIRTVARRAPDDLVLVHGAGSFGHPHAARRGIDETTQSVEGAYETHAAVARLNRRVVGSLNERGVDAAPVHPLSCARRDGEVQVCVEAVEALGDAGFLPVLHGDVVADGRGGASVLSGDELAVEVAVATEDDEVGMCTSSGGVLGSDGEALDRVTSGDDVAELDGAKRADVTGGIRGKVDRLLSLPSGGCVFGPDDVGAYLNGDDVGTLVRRRK